METTELNPSNLHRVIRDVTQPSPQTENTYTIHPVDLDKIYIYRINAKEIIKRIFNSAYGDYDPSTGLLQIRTFELAILAILAALAVWRLLCSITSIPVYKQEINAFKGKYEGQIIDSSEEREKALHATTCALLELAKNKNRENAKKTEESIIALTNTLIEESALEKTDITKEEYLNYVLSAKDESLLINLVSFGVNFLFFVRATGVCSNLFHAMSESTSFLVSLLLFIQVVIHIFAFLILLILTIDKEGKFTTVFSIMTTSLISFGYLAIFDGFQTVIFGIIFAITNSPLLLATTFACLGSFIHGVFTKIIVSFVSTEGDKILKLFSVVSKSDYRIVNSILDMPIELEDNTKATNKIVKLAKLNEFIEGKLGILQTYYPKTKSPVADEIILGEVQSVVRSTATSHNLFVFIIVCFFSYAIIYELDKNWFYYLLIWVQKFDYTYRFTRYFTVRTMLGFKLFVYTVFLISILAVFHVYPM